MRPQIPKLSRVSSTAEGGTYALTTGNPLGRPTEFLHRLFPGAIVTDLREGQLWRYLGNAQFEHLKSGAVLTWDQLGGLVMMRPQA